MAEIFLSHEVTFLFAVVLPSYNRASMLKTAIKSLLLQTCQDFECFVLDDGSTDETPKIFEEFSQMGRFHWQRFEKNNGQHYCRNYAVQRSAGRFITFLDSDDLWLPERLEEFKKAAQSRPEVGFWFSNAYLWKYERVIGTVFDPKRAVPEGPVPGYYAVGEKYLPYVTTNVAIKREAFQEAGLFRQDMKILEDTELYARILGKGFPVGAIPRPLAVRRLHEEQITRDHERDFQESLMALRSGGASLEVEKAYWQEMVLETASYLIKNLNPHKARQFLRQSDVPRNGRFWILFLLSLLPGPFLSLLRHCRTTYLKARYGSWLAPRQYRRVSEWMASLQANKPDSKIFI